MSIHSVFCPVLILQLGRIAIKNSGGARVAGTVAPARLNLVLALGCAFSQQRALLGNSMGFVDRGQQAQQSTRAFEKFLT